MFRSSQFKKTYTFDNLKNEKSKIPRQVKEINRIVASLKTTVGNWPAKEVNALDRAIGEINRTLDKQVTS